jgi:aminomethyltransferase
MTTAAPLQRTALFEAHQKLGARLVEFGGWEMPVQYAGIVEEHKAVRAAAGLFDISHMGEFFVSGDKALSFLNCLLTNDAAKLGVNQGQYTLLLNEKGGVIDDLILYRLHETEFLLVVNAAKIAEDLAWIKHLVPAGVTLSNQSDAYSALALQGPKALEIARKFLGAGWPEPKRNGITAYSWNCQPILTARTGYTGEDGLEFFFASEIAEKFFLGLLEAGAPLGLKPCGLGARDTLRLEACLPLNGNDLSPERTPIAAGLGFFVALDKADDFPGKETLRAEKNGGAREVLVAFRLKDKGPPPRPHYGLFLGAERVGEVTSGAPSPTLGGGIGLGYVQAGAAKPGTVLEVEVRGTRIPVEIVKKPFYKRAAGGIVQNT